MKTSLKTLSALALAAPLASCGVEEERPNIVLFLIDDMGWADCSVPFGEEVYPRNEIFNTPNLDRLAELVMVLFSAYVSSTS